MLALCRPCDSDRSRAQPRQVRARTPAPAPSQPAACVPASAWASTPPPRLWEAGAGRERGDQAAAKAGDGARGAGQLAARWPQAGLAPGHSPRGKTPAGTCSAPPASPAPRAPSCLSEEGKGPRRAVSAGRSRPCSGSAPPAPRRPRPWQHTHLLTLRGQHGGLVLKLRTRGSRLSAGRLFAKTRGAGCGHSPIPQVSVRGRAGPLPAPSRLGGGC